MPVMSWFWGAFSGAPGMALRGRIFLFSSPLASMVDRLANEHGVSRPPTLLGKWDLYAIWNIHLVLPSLNR
jgi:hypothetical protein